jgi:hypothetical protein
VTNSSKKRRRIQQSLGSFVRRPSSVSNITDSKKKELDRLVVLMIACDFQPFSIVNDSGFKDLVKALDPKYSLPSKTTIRNKLLPEFVNEQRRKLEEILHEVKYVSLTTDMWSFIIGESYITTMYLSFRI